MTDETNKQPPPHVAEAARTVDQWLREQEAHDKQPQRVESAFDKFKRLPRSDTPAPAEPWRDPRAEPPAGRWRNPRGAA
jgi:hypothetical protein